MYYFDYVKKTIGSSDEFEEIYFKKKLVKSLAKLVAEKYSDTKISDIRTSCFQHFWKHVRRESISSYILEDFENMKLVSVQIQDRASIILDPINLSYVDLVKDFFDSHFVPYSPKDLSLLEEEIEFEKVKAISNNSINVAPYLVVARIREYILECVTREFLDKNKDEFKILLSSLRLNILYKNTKTLNPELYFALRKIRQILIDREQDKSHIELEEMLFEMEEREYYEQYKLNAHHFDMLEDYLDTWYCDLLEVICNPRVEEAKSLMKLLISKNSDMTSVNSDLTMTH